MLSTPAASVRPCVQRRRVRRPAVPTQAAAHRAARAGGMSAQRRLTGEVNCFELGEDCGSSGPWQLAVELQGQRAGGRGALMSVPPCRAGSWRRRRRHGREVGTAARTAWARTR